MKKRFVLGCSLVLFLVTGCGKYEELKYNGDEVFRACSDQEIALFEKKVKVIVGKDQGFTIVNDEFVSENYTKGEHKFKKEKVNNCFFVSYNEVTDNKFGTSSSIYYDDPIYGRLGIRVSGVYSFRVVNNRQFGTYGTSMEVFYDIIQSHIIYTLSERLTSNKYVSYLDLFRTAYFEDSELESVNEYVNDCGVEVTEVLFHSISLDEESENNIFN